MDLITWCIVGVPMLQTIALQTFFGDSPIRLVGYELPYDAALKFPDKHPASALNYVFNMRVRCFAPQSRSTLSLIHSVCVFIQLTPVDEEKYIDPQFDASDIESGDEMSSADIRSPMATASSAAAAAMMDAIAEDEDEESALMLQRDSDDDNEGKLERDDAEDQDSFKVSS